MNLDSAFGACQHRPTDRAIQLRPQPDGYSIAAA
jgi:hypothetical protein